MPDDYVAPDDPFIFGYEGAFYLFAGRKVPTPDGKQDPLSLISLTIEDALTDFVYQSTGRPQTYEQQREDFWARGGV